MEGLEDASPTLTSERALLHLRLHPETRGQGPLRVQWT